MSGLTITALLWWLICVAVLIGSAALAYLQARFAVPAPADALLPPLSLLVPLKHDSPSLGVATRSIFLQDYPEFDLIFSAVEDNSPAISHALDVARAQRRRRWAFLRSVPAQGGVNPKTANLLQSYATARYDQIVIKDSNTVLPEGHLRVMAAALTGDVGLVASPPILRSPATFAAWIECAMVNGHGARLLLAGTQLGVGVGIGAVMLLHRSDLDAAGGLAGLATRLADDHAISRRLAANGKRTVLTARTVDQMVGERALSTVFERHTRWAACRRTEEPLVFLLEIITGGLAAMVAAGLALQGLWSLAAIAATALLWMLVEVTLSAALHWPVSLQLALAIPCREVLAAIIWARALVTPVSYWLGRRR